MFLIYQDYQHNNFMLYEALAAVVGQRQVEFVDAEGIIGQRALSPDIRAFFMPGGADLYYCEKLNGDGNRLIRDYVKAGGTYFGICAGAYYAAREILWCENRQDEIKGPRELAFFPGLAYGPVYEFQSRFPEDEYVAVTIETSAGQRVPVRYWSGPRFAEPYPDDMEILATYQDLKHDNAAIIRLPFGQGRVILSSPHIEISASLLEKSHYPHARWPGFEETLKALQSGGQEKYWQQLIQSL